MRLRAALVAALVILGGLVLYVIDMWWSGSGSGAKLYGLLGLDDSVGSVVEMLANKPVMQFCWRGGSPGSCT